MNELVSVCITTYNRKHLLPLTLKSVLTQTYKNIEIIIVDDFSNDGTQQLIENELLKLDIRIRYIRHEENKGLAAARNTAIYNAKGKYFSFCDDDDQWLPNFIEEFVKVAKNYDDKWCFCCGEVIKNKNKDIKRIHNEHDLTLKNAILKGYVPPCAAQFYYTNTLKEVGGYNEEIKSGVDHDLWLSLSYKNISLHFLPLSLAVPNIEDSHERMTKNFERRTFLLDQSLSIWKKKFISEYGMDIYKNFYLRYKYVIFKSILLNNLKNKEITKVINLFLTQRNFFFLPLLIKQTLVFLFRDKKNPVIIKPEFEIDNKNFKKTL